MNEEAEKAEQVETLLATPDLAGALDSEAFRRFLDQIPIAIVISQMKDPERIVYANPEFEKLSGQSVAAVVEQSWSVLKGHIEGEETPRELGAAIVGSTDFVATFRLERGGEEFSIVDAYSNVIEDDDGKPCYRLAALVDVGAHGQGREELERAVREKDTLLLEVQHRVKNNLQMITALIRMETRNAMEPDQKRFERLAGRVDALAILYQTLSGDDHKDEVDLGVYLSQIASAVMNSHAVEGIRLDMKVDTYPEIGRASCRERV